MGREAAHEAIKEHAVAAALSMRAEGKTENELIARLAGDKRLGLDAATLDQVMQEPLSFVGAAQAQAGLFVKQVQALCERYPDGAAYAPGGLL